MSKGEGFYEWQQHGEECSFAIIHESKLYQINSNHQIGESCIRLDYEEQKADTCNSGRSKHFSSSSRN